MSEPQLARTVYGPKSGRQLRKGLTASQIGPEAEHIKEHAWVDGKAPTKSQLGDGDPDAGTPLGAPLVPTPSGLPGPDQSTTVPLVAPDLSGEDVEKRLTPPATVPDGMGGDGTTEVPGATAETVEAAKGDADAAKADGSDKKPEPTGDTGSQPAKRTTAKRTGSARTGSGS
ncbi:hypothetical protein AB0F93_00125 [Micromonospora tulbaghiae]|uniref:hypothetical protein n=1 Tax=Micromonospora tulbaghiae TaxID=479978 RepID=UPI00332C8F7D